MTGPSGFQIEIRAGDHVATVVEVGGGIRRYAVGAVDVLDGYDADAICRSGRGQLLLPWPNRIREGAYAFAGEQRQLALTEPSTRSAIHGLVRWANWTLAEREEHRAVLRHTLHPQPGYPHTLELVVEYALDGAGLAVETTAVNAGREPCPFGAGAHPYLAVRGGTVDVSVLRLPARTRLLADEHGIPTGAEPVDGTPFDFRGGRPIGSTALDTAFADLERDADGRARVRLDDTVVWLGEAYRYAMLFTGDPLPDVARRSLAVEPMTCAPNAFQSGDGLLVLEPGESFSASFGIEPNAS
ncbi:MAG TPA: aldose 1-epimerase family protein [Gaiellaceae bacterium]